MNQTIFGLADFTFTAALNVSITKARVCAIAQMFFVFCFFPKNRIGHEL